MTREEAVAKIVAAGTFSGPDMDGLLDCSPPELALIVQTIHDRALSPPKSAWDYVVEVFGDCVAVADVVIPLTGAIAGLYGLGKL